MTSRMPCAIRAGRHDGPNLKKRMTKEKLEAQGITKAIAEAAAKEKTIFLSAKVLGASQTLNYETKRQKCLQVFAAYGLTASWMKEHVPDPAKTNSEKSSRELFNEAVKSCNCKDFSTCSN